jgi:hypothetical protein
MEDASMNWKLLVKYSFASALLVAVALCLLLPLQNINAGSPEPTPHPTMNIITRLQPNRTTNAETNQVKGRLIEQAPLPSKIEESPASAVDQQTFHAIADATILEGYPTVNFGDTSDMWAGYDEYLDPHGETARSLVKFDLASLPSDQVITKATLRVFLVTSWDYPDTSRTISTYRITSNWSEDNVNWNNKPGYGSAYGSRSIVHDAWDWYEFDVTKLVNAWYAGTYTNYGIMLRGPEISGDDSSWRGFGTRESSYTPQLVIDFTASTSTPTATQTPTPTATQTPTPTATQTPTPTATQTPTQTATQTPTQTATQTPSPTDAANWTYLPMILKYAGATPTPTATPTATNIPSPTNTPAATKTPGLGLPMPGDWSGITDQDYPVNFTVASSRTYVEKFSIRYRLICTYGSVTTGSPIIIGHFAITNNQFTISYTGHGAVYKGTFTSTTSAHGTWSCSYNDPNVGYCSGSGTWTAAP